MREAVRLDKGRCRVPRCDTGMIVEPAHITQHRGMGGNPSGDRTTLESVMALCHFHHRAYDTGETGRLEIVLLTDRGTRGLCEFTLNGEFAGVG